MPTTRLTILWIMYGANCSPSKRRNSSGITPLTPLLLITRIEGVIISGKTSMIKGL